MLFDNTGHAYCTALCPIGPAMAHSFAVHVSAVFCCSNAFTTNLSIAERHRRAAIWAVRGVWSPCVGEGAAPIISGSIMGREQPRPADFHEATQRLSSIFAPYSCPQRETLTSACANNQELDEPNHLARGFRTLGETWQQWNALGPGLGSRTGCPRTQRGI